MEAANHYKGAESMNLRREVHKTDGGDYNVVIPREIMLYLNNPKYIKFTITRNGKVRIEPA